MNRRVLAVALAVLVIAALGLALGAVPIPLGEVWGALLDPDAAQAAIVRDLRLPRVLLGFLIGGTLAV